MKLKFIDLFAGIGGFRAGFEMACKKNNIQPVCVFTSEIKRSAIEVYQDNFPGEEISGDITKIDEKNIPEFDVLLAGFPCQAFSTAGVRRGFLDTRGTLFFDIERILQKHSPQAFILENVEGLVTHDLQNKNDQIGKTLQTILFNLRKLGYTVNWKVLNGLDFGLAQNRKRIFLVGTKDKLIPLDNFRKKNVPLKKILEKNKPSDDIQISKVLFKKYDKESLYGKAIKDRRGGEDNIHSWDLDLKGKTNRHQKKILNEILKARRNKKWAEIKGIAWSDGMPLTHKEINSFCEVPELLENLEDLVKKGYLVKRHPADFIDSKEGHKIKAPREDLPKGYDLVTGKLSFEISNILHPDGYTPTLTATDASKLALIDGENLRKLTAREMARLFGFPNKFKLNKKVNYFDLFGNSIAVNVVEKVSDNLIKFYFLKENYSEEISLNSEAVQQELF